MKCPNCSAKISAKHFDTDYGWYECPKCGEAYTPDEIEESNTGTSPKKRASQAQSLQKKYGASTSGNRRTKVEPVRSGAGNSKPVAKGKKRAKADAEALAAFEAKALKPRKSADVDTVKHRDEVPTAEILNVWADEIETIGEETGVKIDRLNAREFYVMNIWRELHLKHGVKARDKSQKFVLCSDHG